MTTLTVFVDVWVTASSSIVSKEYKYNSFRPDNTLYKGGGNWYYGRVLLSRTSSNVPSVYNFRYRFKRWTKSTLNYVWQTGVDSDNTGWYFSDGGLRQMIIANETYNPDLIDQNEEYVQCYVGETWYHTFEIINFAGITYTIIFNGSGGTSSSPVPNLSIIYGASTNFPPSNTYTRTGYVFVGWSLHIAGEYLQDYDAGASYGWTEAHAGQNCTAYAHWIKLDGYEIYYRSMSLFSQGEITDGFMENTIAVYNVSVNLRINNYVKDGYSFLGWSTYQSVTTFDLPPTVSYTDGASFIYGGGGAEKYKYLYAVWSARTYTITYNGNGNSSGTMVATTVTYDSNVTLRANNFFKTGFTFSGWARTNTAIVVEYNNNAVFKYNLENIAVNDITLYAIWSCVITFSSTLDGVVTTTSVIKNNGSFLDDFPVLDNIIGRFIFSGWVRSDNTEVSFFTVTGAITLYAKWVIDNSISFSSLKSKFMGTTTRNQIYLSEYYLYSGYVNSPGGDGIPTTGKISISNFIGKVRSNYANVSSWVLVEGNAKGNMDTTNGIDIVSVGGTLLTSTDYSFGNIGIIKFPFYWFNTNYETVNTNNADAGIVWNNVSALTFSGGSSAYNNWEATFASGVLIGQSDRVTLLAKQFNPYKSNDFSFKRFIVKQRHYYESPETEFEIILIRGPTTQYIEIRMVKYNSSYTGVWNLSNKTNFLNVFGTTYPMATNESFVLMGNATGTNWELKKNYYLGSNPIINIGTNLVLYLNGYNINGNNNINIVSSLSSWYNSGESKWNNTIFSSFTVTSTVSTKNPSYFNNSVLFGINKGFSSTINFLIYPQMNIFVVFTLSEDFYLTQNNRVVWADTHDNRTLAIDRLGRFINVKVGIGPTITVPNYIVPHDISTIVNCEYNSQGLPGAVYINGVLKLSFSSLAQSVASSSTTYFGADINITNSLVGYIREIIIINRLLTDVERRNIHNLLYTKWGGDYYVTTNNLLLRHDVLNCDGSNNNPSLKLSDKLPQWYNSAVLTTFTTTQSDTTRQPIYRYLNKGIYFSTTQVFVSTIDINIYPTLNIFILKESLIKPTDTTYGNPNPNSKQVLFSNNTFSRGLYYYEDDQSGYLKIGAGVGNTKTFKMLFSYTNSRKILFNIEYNAPSLVSTLYINNVSRLTFDSLAVETAASSTYIGNNASYHNTGGFNLHEFIIFKGLLTVSERTNIYNYFKSKHPV
jgi:uncharacterized repeat protein (TIGR02543 family)